MRKISFTIGTPPTAEDLQREAEEMKQAASEAGRVGPIPDSRPAPAAVIDRDSQGNIRRRPCGGCG